jgi:tripartite-type tricarboxylate transporter receptor subunit TctC
LIDYTKWRPGKLTMASPGTDSAPFLAEMLFLQMADIKMTQVPYRGASPAFTDLIPAASTAISAAVHCFPTHGRVRLMFWRPPDRNEMRHLDVPTIAEAGVRDYDVTAWQALFVPAKTPPEIVRKISTDTNTALTDPPIKDKLAKTDYVAEGSSPEELEKLLKSEIAKWSAVIKSVGIKIERRNFAEIDSSLRYA